MSSGDANNVVDPVVLAIVRNVRYHNIACVALLVWQYLLTVDEDVRYIWPMRNRSPFKWFYIYLRYVVIFVSIMHNWLIAEVVDSNSPPIVCKMWHTYVYSLAQSLATMVELILATRVFALYNRSKKIAFLLFILILTEFGGTMRLLYMQQDLAFYKTCLLMQMTEYAKNQSIFVFLVHCTLVCLTVFKYLIAWRAGWSRTPLVSLVVRDGSTMYATMAFVFFSLYVACQSQSEQETSVFPWVVSLLSISGCRMILSMERLARRETYPDEPILTSQFTVRTFESWE